MDLVFVPIQSVCVFWLGNLTHLHLNYQYICSYCHFLYCLGLIFFLLFLDYISPSNICCKGGLVVLNSLNFCLSAKLFISSCILNEILAGYSKLGCRFSPFSTLNISSRPFWPSEFLLKDHLLNVWGFPCMLLVAFPLLLLIFFPLSLLV